MSMANVRSAFVETLGDRATCLSATMGYEQGGRQQVLTFRVVAGGGSPTTLTETVPASTDLESHARIMAAAYLETLT